MSDTENTFRHLVADHLGVTPEQVTAEAKFDADLGADSLDFVELIMTAEHEFEIEITNEQAEGVETFGQAVTLIEGLIA